jgi:transcriptional regulator with XRE-family HTH domain
MPSIGETLREARMRQRLDIADVEDRTKIRAKYLRALENEEFGMLPGPTFVKTFLRTYAEMLGLDPHVLVEEYRAGFEREDRDRRHGPPIGPGSLVLLALVGIVAVLVAIGLASDDDGGADQASVPETTTTERTVEAKPKPQRPRRVRLRVTPATPTYVCVDRGPGTPVVFEDTIDSPQTFRGKRIRVNLGRRDVQLRRNGKAVPVTPGPDPIGFAFTPRGSRELPSGERPCA